jgi:hypothetical protein
MLRRSALVVVADDGQVAMLGGQVAAEQVLGAVRVLVLVDHDLLPARLVLRQHVGVLLEQEHGAHEEVVEVDRVILGQLALVGLVDARGRLVVVVGRLPKRRGDVRQLVLALADPGQHPVRAEPLLVEVQALEDGLDDRHLVGAVVDREAPSEADDGPVAPQDAGADGVEGPDRRLACRLLADEAGDPVPHLAGRLVRERDRHDLPRLVAGRHEVGDAVREDAGLPASRSGQDEERPGQVADSLPLRRVQAIEDLLRGQPRARCRGGRDIGGHRVRF